MWEGINVKKLGLVLALAFVMGGCSAKPDSTTAVGSTAIQPLIEAVAHDFMQTNKGMVINVQGGGSGTGLSQVQAGAVEIGNSDVFAEEKKGIDGDKLIDHKVAVVGTVPVANKENGVSSLTSEELRAIFAGQLKNWKELGGNDLPILVVNRTEGSGTRVNFEKYGLDNQDVIPSQEQEANGMTREIVGQTPGAISYMAIPYINEQVVPLKIDGVKASTDTIKTNEWKIWSYEHMYTQKDPSEQTKQFIEYVLSKPIQEKVFKKLGYIPISEMEVERKQTGEVIPLVGGQN